MHEKLSNHVWPNSHTIPVFFEPKRYYTFQGNPSAVGALHTRGLRKIRNFQPIFRYILENVQDKPIVSIER